MANNNINTSSFLQLCFDDIIEKAKGDFTNSLILFPNRRAIQFFKQYIKHNDKVKKPCFLPVMFSISDLIDNYLIDYSKAENLQLIYILYKVFSQIYYQDNPKQEKQSFEEFYSFGQIILNDFDQIDKSQVNAQHLYKNLQDYKDLQQNPTTYLTKEQIDIINQLFNTNLSTKIKDNFVQLWNCLSRVYQEFNDILNENKIGYGGFVQKTFLSRLKSGQIFIEQKDIYVVGFSVVNNLEKDLFLTLKENYNTSFYWDYDNYYISMKDNEAGIFLRENLNNFANTSFGSKYFDNIINNDLKITNIETSYQTNYLAYIPLWFEKLEKNYPDFNNVAIILCDQSLISMVIKSIPEQYKDKCNITMGYPFNQSFLYGDILYRIDELIDEDKLTTDNLIDSLKEVVNNITISNNEQYWQIPLIEKVFVSVNSFIDQINQDINNESFKEDLSKNILKKVIHKELYSLKADIISDKLSKIQILGMLETRSLDFDHILMLSATDDNLPNVKKDQTFIPNTFLTAYNMNNIDRKTGVFAYYFYRLLQRSKTIDYVYSTTAEGKLQEPSRFIRQIELELLPEKQKINKGKDFITTMHLGSDGNLQPRIENHKYYFNSSLIDFFNDGTKALYPSHLNKLISCFKKFYLSRMLNIKQDIDDKDYAKIALGNIFHDIASSIYTSCDILKLDSSQIDTKISQEIDNYIAKPTDDTLDAFTKNSIIKNIRVCADAFHIDIIKQLLKKMILSDKKHNNIFLVGEYELKHDLTICNNVVVHLAGRTDRIDITKKDDKYYLTIIDYKTGSAKEDNDRVVNNIASLYCSNSNDKIRENKFEIMFYSYLLYNNQDVACELLKKKGINLEVQNNEILPQLIYVIKPEQRGILLDTGIRKPKITFVYDENINRQFEAYLRKLIFTAFNPLIQINDSEDTEDINPILAQSDLTIEEIENCLKNISMDFDKKNGEQINYTGSDCEWCEYKLLCKIGTDKLINVDSDDTQDDD